jgi:hypothetical protein
LSLPRTGIASLPIVGRGMQALARYSFYRVDESPTPWEEGIPSPLGDDARAGKLRSAGSSRDAGLSMGEPSEGGLSFSASTASAPREGVSWSGPSRTDETHSLLAQVDGSSSSLLRSIARVATPILEVADALRAVRLNQVRLSDDLTLKLNGRTGRHARCFAILTHRF